MLKSLSILGLRGFAEEQTLRFAQPNNNPGSGLTVVVGANNTGKTTIIEALRALIHRPKVSFSQGCRNQLAGDQITLKATDEKEATLIIQSTEPGSSETKTTSENGVVDCTRLLVLQSRRAFEPYFSAGEMNREQYISSTEFPTTRGSSSGYFSQRMTNIANNPSIKNKFDEVLGRVMNPVLDWAIDLADLGQHFIKVKRAKFNHTSEGLGEGLISLLYIIDALYDSKENDFIAIDEPELSLHPALQRKLSVLLTEYAATRQIVLSTHSPYFANFEALEKGSTVARVHLIRDQSRISQLSETTAQQISALIHNLNNPHIFGLNAQEVFFLEDRVILVEGQEDVIFYKRVQQQLEEQLGGDFYGWGVGGAGNMELIAKVLLDLGFQHVVGIFDKNQQALQERLSQDFPKFHFFVIPANDVRTKQEAPVKPAVEGLLDAENKNVRPEYIGEMKRLFEETNQYLRS